MHELEIQKYLRAKGMVGALESEYGVKAKWSEKHPNLVLLKYDQIEGRMGEKLVQECRGIVLDAANNWNVVCRPFDKFFNLGEGHAAEIDWQSATVAEKLDGTMIALYWYNGYWNVSTTGNPDAAGQVNDLGMTFANLFWNTLDIYDINVADWLNLGIGASHHLTYIFELCTPENRVVVPHATGKATLLAVRSTQTGQYVPIDLYRGNVPFPVVTTFDLTDFDSIVETFAALDPLRFEGYVVSDAQGNRVKVKHPGYVALHHLKDSIGTSVKSIVNIVRNGESSEFLTYFPEFTEKYVDVNTRFLNLAHDLDHHYWQIKDIADRKAFALEAQKCKIPSVMFNLRDRKINTVFDHLKDMNVEHLMRALGVKE